MWLDGDKYRRKLYGNANCIPTHKYGVYSREIHDVEYTESNLRDVLYEPRVKNGLSLSKVVRDIGTINLDDKVDATKVSSYVVGKIPVILKSSPTVLIIVKICALY